MTTWMARAGALLLLAPLFAGCIVDEPIKVALRVGPGQSVLLDADQTLDGSIVVERDGHLLIDHAHINVLQSVIVEGGVLESRDSSIRFLRSAQYARHDFSSAGIVTLNNTAIDGARSVLVVTGAISIEAGSVESDNLRLMGGALVSHATEWALGGSDASGSALSVSDGSCTLANGTIVLASHSGGVAARAGALHLENLTLDGSQAQGPLLEAMEEGTIDAWGVTLRTSDALNSIVGSAGTIRLVDTPPPRGLAAQAFAGSGTLTVAWTVTARALSPPGNLPVGGLNLTLESTQSPGAPTSTGVTDEKGEAKLVAVEYVLGSTGTRSGNPHVVVANDGGKRGASPTIVVESPTAVDVFVVG